MDPWDGIGKRGSNHKEQTKTKVFLLRKKKKIIISYRNPPFFLFVRELDVDVSREVWTMQRHVVPRDGAQSSEATTGGTNECKEDYESEKEAAAGDGDDCVFCWA